MPITLTFSTKKELKKLLKELNLEDVAAPAKRGRKAGSTTKKSTRTIAVKKKPGRKPGRKKATATRATRGRAATKAKPTRKRAGRKGETLTSQIKGTIQKFVDKKQQFTAKDIYEDLSKQNKKVNRQSVITSVLKQMNTTFANVPVTEAKGAGPRPVKLYKPAG